MRYFSVRDVVTVEKTDGELLRLASSEAHENLTLLVRVQVKHPDVYYANGEERTISLSGPVEVLSSANIEKGVSITVKKALADSEKAIAQRIFEAMVEYRDELSAAKAEDDAVEEAASR